MNTGNKLLNAITCCFKVYEEVPSSSVVSLLHGKMFELKFFFFSFICLACRIWNSYILLSLSQLPCHHVRETR